MLRRGTLESGVHHGLKVFCCGCNRIIYTKILAVVTRGGENVTYIESDYSL